MKVWTAIVGISAASNLDKDWYFEPGFNVSLETSKGKYIAKSNLKLLKVARTALIPIVI